jgi:hypothetical protein
MVTNPTDIRSTAVGQASRTGPVGRLARLLAAAVGTWSAYSLWTDRAFIFNEPDEGLLLLTGLAVYGVYQIAAVFGRGKLVLATLAVVAAAASALAIAREGSLWAPPLSWLAWGLDIGFLVVISATMLVAMVVGTPGCEIGVLAELTPRLRRQAHRAEAMFCLVGLHKLDAWEARQPWHRGSDR